MFLVHEQSRKHGAGFPVRVGRTVAAAAPQAHCGRREEKTLAYAAARGAADRRMRFEATALPLMPVLHRAALRLTRDPQLAADLVQDTCLRAYRAFDQFTPGTNCRAWLFSILHSVFNTGYRKAQRELTGMQMAAFEVEYENWLGGSDGLPAAAEHDAAIDPMDPQVERALDALPEAFRSAVMLVDIGELSYEEAAAVMGCAVGTVRSRLSRARKVLFAALLTYALETGYARLEGRA
jgi:RNA polymerase sigma-70 factor (ECF subfamily)